ncbi:MAG: Nramp family divalent metal transporter [Candidatus Hydrogenedentes bacterium]|nr:Nramp family divalent metal transporter [Candidatus Hydrogenedentota bacterium]
MADDTANTRTANGRQSCLRTLLPGLLVAATGVGAGDLATASLTGAHLGVAILWAVVVGAFLKFVLTEGLGRWQLATGKTFLEGCAEHMGVPFLIAFFAYLFPWSFFVGSAMMSACGATMHAWLPFFEDASTGKIIYGIGHGIAGVLLIRAGGYRLFSRVMSVCIGLMFVTVITAPVLQPVDWAAVLRGLIVPRIPDVSPEARSWTIALMGGVGGTLTVLCYGYWIREEGRTGKTAAQTCRIDLGAGYTMTALFGIAMVIIGSQVTVEGKGATLIIDISDRLGNTIGAYAKWVFLAGAYGAVFSSLLGVWQSVPYIFADVVSLTMRDNDEKRAVRVSENSATYRTYLYLLATIPMFGLFYGFGAMQKIYAVIGACFMPFLAFALLYLNGHSNWVGREFKNRPITSLILGGILLFFLYAGWQEIP